MRTFRLSDAAFAALAAGRPGTATLAVLRRAQLSRHLLMLSETLRLPGGKIPRWYAERPADLADPMVALHTAATLAALRSGTPPPPDPIASARHLTATHDGRTLRIRLEDTDPLRARLGLTPFRQVTDDEAAEWQTTLAAAWRILVTRHRAAAETMAAVLTVIVPLEAPRSAAGISATSADAYGAAAVSPPADARSLAVGLLHETQHSVLNAVRTLFDLVTPPADAGHYSPWRDDPRPPSGVLHGAYAYQAVSRFWRAEAAASRHTPGESEPLAASEEGRPPADEDGQPTAGDGGQPTPSDGAQPTPTDRAQPTPTDRAQPTPTDRAQPTPSEGGRPAGGAHGRLAAFEFARWRAAVAEAADGLLGDGRLTAAGRRFVGAMRDEVNGWLGEPVDVDVARLAAGANAEHRARWRLRNLIVAPATVDAVVAAWRAGGPPPETAEPAVRTGSGRALEHSERLDLVHRLLRAAAPRGAGVSGDQSLPPGGGVRPGDAAYLGGDHGTAFHAYLKELESRRTQPSPRPSPRDLELWAGLAMVSPHAALRERPELVRAVYLALRKPESDAPGSSDTPGSSNAPSSSHPPGSSHAASSSHTPGSSDAPDAVGFAGDASCVESDRAGEVDLRALGRWLPG